MQCGIYIHVPFCASKCPYCDFYSAVPRSEAEKDAYVQALIREMRKQTGVTADTLYFGGGTPTLLGGERLEKLICTARDCFSMTDTAEITLEANPADQLLSTLERFAAAGGNRLSLGMQSSDENILRILGRRHTPRDVQRTMADARSVGITNISLDMMLAVPTQTTHHIEQDVAVCAALGASHVSAYLLKIEPGTPFFAAGDTLCLPDEDKAADLYLAAVDALETQGYRQYEISNFAKDGKQSRHNLKYWNGEPYIGFGPAAHSFLDGVRCFYPRDTAAFVAGNTPTADVDGEIQAGSETEYAMLRLRLCEGLTADGFWRRFQKEIPAAWLTAAKRLPSALVRADERGIAFTKEGFLVSNVLISRILNL